ncbi:ATM_1a_G0028310.mRNA.1.CDS.1 [Saccharomyces cerevisiae]|nr:ATM_1a_G0028310.mRNA.1.CDS.1 [Saccharomyces cerevisiae]CAI7096299.1 ATM_1a_G0028310.mRNA.1.CDS.1 [Saccharomyces cerevisiae]
MISLDGTSNKSEGWAPMLSLVFPCALLELLPHTKGNYSLQVYSRKLADARRPFVIPVPFFNVLNGGAHAGGSLAMQELKSLQSGSELCRSLRWVRKFAIISRRYWRRTIWTFRWKCW